MESAQFDPPPPIARLAFARALLREGKKSDPAWPTLAAAAFFAACALGFAMSALVAPPSTLTPIASAPL